MGLESQVLQKHSHTHSRQQEGQHSTVYRIYVFVSDLWRVVCEVKYKIGLMIVCCYVVGGRKSTHKRTHTQALRRELQTALVLKCRSGNERGSQHNVGCAGILMWMCVRACA